MVFLGNRHHVGAFGNAVELIRRAVAVNNLGIRRRFVAFARERYGYGVGAVKEGCYRARYRSSRAFCPAGNAYLEAGIEGLIADGFGCKLPGVATQLDSVYDDACIRKEVGIVRNKEE